MDRRVFAAEVRLVQWKSPTTRNYQSIWGNLIIAFNDLEIALGGALMRILKNNDEHIGAVFVSVLGFRQKYDLLKALAKKIENPRVREEFLDNLDSARIVSEERNRYVHAGYTTLVRDQNTIEVIVHQRLKDFSKESLYDFAEDEGFKHIKPIDMPRLEEITNDASEVAFSILQLSEKFG